MDENEVNDLQDEEQPLQEKNDEVKIVFDINSNALEMYYDEKGRYIKAGNDEI